MNENNTNTTPDTNFIFPALLKVQEALPNPKKDKKGYGYNYSALDQVLAIIKPVLAKHGLGILQTPEGSYNDGVNIKTILFHKSGQHIIERFTIPCKVGTNPTQDFGAALTYGKRYALLSLLAICPEDEDTDGVGSKPAPKLSQDDLVDQADKRLGKLKLNKWAEANKFWPHKASYSSLQRFLKLSDQELLAKANQWELDKAA